MRVGNRDIILPYDLVLVETIEKSTGGIILPEGVKLKNVACGYVAEKGWGYPYFNQNYFDANEPWKKEKSEKTTLIPLRVNLGDYVYFSLTDATEIKLNNKTYQIIRENQILIIERQIDSLLSKEGA